VVKVSVLIPVYNVEKYIVRCLQSVAAQTYMGAMECIVVDDCSPDNSISLAKEFISSLNSTIDFRIIHHEQNRGLAAARNTGVENSNGEFVMHLDSDDWLEPDAIEILVRKQSETNADIVSGNALAHYENHVKTFDEPDYANNSEMVSQTIKLTMDHVIWRRLIRKNLYTDNGITAVEGINIGEDHHTLPRLAYFAKSIAKVDKVIYNYNCMNTNSYMYKSKRCISLNKYISDCRSIQILKDFFEAKDKNLIKKLDLIEQKYKRNSIAMSVALSDHKGYRSLCQAQQISSHYYQARFKYLCMSIHHKAKYLLSRMLNPITQQQ